MNEVYTEKEILGDALNSEKNATTLYNLGANECVHDNLRETMLDLLAKEHDIQVDVFQGMEFAVVEVQITNLNFTRGSFNHTHCNLFLIVPDALRESGLP